MIVGFPIYPHVDLLDVAGPLEMLSWADDIKVVVTAETPGPIPTRSGLTIHADVAFADAPKFDVLWTPGGDPAALSTLMYGPSRVYLDFLIRQSKDATYVCSVCEGALLLAAAGLLDGYRVTTHWAFIPCFIERFPKVMLAPGHPRFWLDGNRLTGGGISSGLDEALELIRLLKGDAAAQDVQQSTQYYPKPPVSSKIPPATSCPLPPPPRVARAAT